MTRGQSSLAVLALLLGCAGYQYVEPIDSEPHDEGPGGVNASGTIGSGGGGKPGVTNAGGGRGGKPAMPSAGRGGTTSAGKPTVPDDGGAAGEASDGGSGGEPGVAAPLCDETTATVLGNMNQSVNVLGNVCLEIALTADQTWITKVTLQPEFGQYPLPFTWTNCSATGSGAFTANYGNQVIQPVNLQCPIWIKLGGNAAQQVNVQWWGG